MYKKVFITLICFALFDALFGGAVAALLQVGGWSPLDQRINNVYQLVFGVVILGSFVWLYQTAKSFKEITVLITLLVGYVEDTLYFLFIPLVNPIIKLITKGAVYQISGLFPDHISGWLGWIGRMFLGKNISFQMTTILLINLAAVVISVALIELNKRKFSKKKQF
jgi:hypothetical protein